MRFNTSLLHAGTTKEIHGATLPPIYQVSAFEQETSGNLEKYLKIKHRDFVTQELQTRQSQHLRTELQSWKVELLRSHVPLVWQRLRMHF